MTGWLGIAAVALGGCGRVNFDARVDASADGATCNSISRLADDFADGARDLVLWGTASAAPGSSFAEVGGELVLSLAPNTAFANTQYATRRYYDLRGERVVAEVTQLGGPQTSGFLVVFHDGSNLVTILASNGMLIVRQLLDGAPMDLLTMAYDAIEHRYWAISAADGRVLFETSRDAVTFELLLDTAAPFDVSLVGVRIGGMTSAAIASPGEVRFGAFNGGIATGITCPASALVDGFDDGVVGHAWQASFTDPCCTQTETGGVLQLASNGTVGYVARRSAAGFDLRDSQVSVMMPSAPVSADFSSWLAASRDVENQLVLSIGGGQANALAIVGGLGTPAMTPRDPSEVHLRIREAAGTVYFELSPDKSQWRIVRQLLTPFPVDDVTMSLEAGAGTASVADQATFDDFNVP